MLGDVLAYVDVVVWVKEGHVSAGGGRCHATNRR